MPAAAGHLPSDSAGADTGGERHNDTEDGEQGVRGTCRRESTQGQPASETVEQRLPCCVALPWPSRGRPVAGPHREGLSPRSTEGAQSGTNAPRAVGCT